MYKRFHIQSTQTQAQTQSRDFWELLSTSTPPRHQFDPAHRLYTLVVFIAIGVFSCVN